MLQNCHKRMLYNFFKLFMPIKTVYDMYVRHPPPPKKRRFRKQKTIPYAKTANCTCALRFGESITAETGIKVGLYT